MPAVQVNATVISAELFSMGDSLKAAIITSSAALLTRTQEDLHANAKAACDHLDVMGRKLDGVRNGISQRLGISLSAKLRGQIKEIDAESVNEAMGVIDQRLDSYRYVFLDVLQSKRRENLALLARRAGALGRALQDAIGQIAGPNLAGSPLYFEQFFADTLNQLSQSDWEPTPDS